MAELIETIPIADVKIGMFIKLDLKWFEHSFPVNSFKITKQSEIEQLKALKLQHISYIPSKSDLTSDEEPLTSDAVAAPEAKADNVYDSLQEAKQVRLERIKQQKSEIARIEAKFVNAATTVQNIKRTIFAKPQETLQEASKLVDGIAEIFQDEDFNLMYLIQQAGAKEELYFHVLNVSVLAMTLAHEMKCSQSQIKEVGMAGLFHDVGKVNIPDQILLKKEPLNRAEQNFLELHPQYGVEIGKKAGMSKITLDVILKHHENIDGSGYPSKLQGDAILMPVRIVSVANTYDNLCNHIDVRQSLTPHEALSTMFVQRRSQFDLKIMTTLVKMLGIYPPGTLVELSNGMVGLVVNVTIGEPMRPQVLIYNENVRQDDAMILDLSLESKDIFITNSMRPGSVRPEIITYLNFRKKINYYVDKKKTSTPK